MSLIDQDTIESNQIKSVFDLQTIRIAYVAKFFTFATVTYCPPVKVLNFTFRQFINNYNEHISRDRTTTKAKKDLVKRGDTGIVKVLLTGYICLFRQAINRRAGTQSGFG